MGRTSIAGERVSQILDAFENCIRKYGLKDSSLPRIAAEAGVKHSIIRHYIGNRDALIALMVSRFTDHYLGVISDALASLPQGATIEAAAGYFFDEVSRLDAENQIFTELFAASTRETSIRHQLCSLYYRITGMVTEVLSNTYPNADKTRVSAAAYSLLGLWIGHSVLFHLDYGAEGIEMASSTARDIVGNLA